MRDTVIFKNNEKYIERVFTIEDDLERIVVEKSKDFFGQKSIYIDAKKKINTNALGGTIPDGFLIDFNTNGDPKFYLVEVELNKHSFFGHIFPQITKFFAFFQTPTLQHELIDKIHNIFEEDKNLSKELNKRIGKKEVYKFLKDLITSSHNILIIIDIPKIEFPDVCNTYQDTWGKMVRFSVLKEFHQLNKKNDTIHTMSPQFENIEEIDSGQADNGKSVGYSINFHLDGVTEEVEKIYQKLSALLQKKMPDVIFNPQRYYISLKENKNFAYIKFRKKRMDIVIMMPRKELKKRIKNHFVKELSDGVQGFYNGPCACVQINPKKGLKEIIDTLLEIKK